MKKFINLFYLVGLVVLSSCSGGSQVSKNREIIVFPPPPEAPKIQFLTSFSKSTDFTGERSTFSSFITGEEEPLEIMKPYGIAVTKNKIFICDTFLGSLELLDLAEGTFSYFVPEGKGKLKKPINCFIDERGFLYIADTEREQIVIFNPELDYAGVISDSSMLRPTDVYVHNNQIYISDISKRNVHVYDEGTKKLIKSLPIDKDGENRLFSPTNIYIHKDQLYVSDIGDFKVKKYDLEGNFLNSVGMIGNTPGTFSRPKGIAVDTDENLYVVDAGFENVQIFNKQGQLLLFFGGSYSKEGDMWLPAKVAIDYQNLDYFQRYVDPSLSLKYLIFVTNQYGPDKVNVYGFVEKKHN